MGNEPIRANFLFGKQLHQVDFRDFVENLLDVGVESSLDSNSNVYQYRTNETVGSNEANLETILETIIESKFGTITFFYGDLKLTLEMRTESPESLSVPPISIRVWGSQFKTYGKYSEREVAERITQFITLIKQIFEYYKDIHVCGGTCPIDEINRIYENDSSQISNLCWLNIIPESLVNKIGSTRLRSAPAWKVEELKNRALMIVLSDNPVHPSEEWENAKSAVSHYLRNK